MLKHFCVGLNYFLSFCHLGNKQIFLFVRGKQPLLLKVNLGNQTYSLQYYHCHFPCPHGASLSHHPSLAIFLDCEHWVSTDPLVQVHAVFPTYKMLQCEKSCAAVHIPWAERKAVWEAEGRTWQSSKQNFLPQNFMSYSLLGPINFGFCSASKRCCSSPVCFSLYIELSIVNCICLLHFLVFVISHCKAIHGKGV